jgi:hypothetical protein
LFDVPHVRDEVEFLMLGRAQARGAPAQSRHIVDVRVLPGALAAGGLGSTTAFTISDTSSGYPFAVTGSGAEVTRAGDPPSIGGAARTGIDDNASASPSSRSFWAPHGEPAKSQMIRQRL